MYLKRLDIHGFKSFSDKVRFDFTQGITAVVGPNGSGKSNVADAIRWVLGEQSAKSLRGSKMEDVIFSGSAGRKALGFAEVSLTLDNSDGALNIEYSEVCITRRVYRSGESEYQINNTVCRLKDIHELLMDTGVGREGYSIIGQGRVDELLSARAEDRRHVFEEAAGIVKYKTRKAEALSKLEKEHQNLIRINDILAELTVQLEPLKRQSETAVKYLELKESLKALQVNIFLNETDRADKEIKSYSESLLQLNRQCEASDEKLAIITADIEDLKEAIIANTGATSDKNENLTEIRLLIEQRENDIKLMEQRISHIDESGERFKGDIERIKQQADKNANELSVEEAKKIELESELTETSDIIIQHEDEFKQFTQRAAEDDKMIATYNREIIELKSRSNEIKSAVNKLEASYEALEERKERVLEDLEISQGERLKNESNSQNLSTKLAGFEEELNRLSEELELLTLENAEFRSKLQTNIEKSQILHREYAESAAKHKILSDLENDYQGYTNSVKTVFIQKSRNPEQYMGILGTVGELLRVPGEYETAIEIALGAAIQNIVVANEEAAAIAIKGLKDAKSGRATFLPLTAMKPRALIMRDKLALEDGFIGTAAELAEYESRYAPVFEHLLARTVVVDTMENGTKMFKKYNYEIKIVTLDGELFNPGGAITGGSVNRKDTSIISRGRMIKTLAEKMAELLAEKEVSDKEIEKIKKQLEIISTDTEGINNEIKALIIGRDNCKNELAAISERLESLRARIKDLERDDREITERLVSTNAGIRLGESRISEMERSISEKEKGLADFEQTLLLERESRNAKMLGLMEYKTKAGVLLQRINSARDYIDRLQEELRFHESELKRLKSEAQDLAYKKAEIKSDSECIRQKISELLIERGKCKQDIESLNLAGGKLNALMNEKDEYYRAAFTETSVLNADIARIESKKEQLETDARRLYDNIWDEYKLTYITAKEYPRFDMTATALGKEERRVRNEINGLGVVNVHAIEEYKAVQSRYDFLVSQRDDIAYAEEKLEIVIKELTELMEKQFTEQFEKISENFGIVFKEIFGGGQAYLKLSDKTDALSSGIEIISQPPGKTLSNMSLLSGGEHALTAIALLFGILRMKPSPFCLLDEIESALDDTNAARFANFLNNFSGGTQFVLITHRKKTMEAADVLYGITMQEQGVSKPVSVRFSKKAI